MTTPYKDRLLDDERRLIEARHPLVQLAHLPGGALKLRRGKVRPDHEVLRRRWDGLWDTMAEGRLTPDEAFEDVRVELLEKDDVVLYWIAVVSLADLGAHDAQVQVALQCAVQSLDLLERRDAVLGRVLPLEDNLLVDHLSVDAERMSSLAVGWGAVASGQRSARFGDAGDVSASEHAAELARRASASLWTAATTNARREGYEEARADGGGLKAPVRRWAPEDAPASGSAARRTLVAVPVVELGLGRGESKHGVERIAGKGLYLHPAADLPFVREGLRAKHPHLSHVVDRLLSDLHEGGVARLRPTLLLGDPGSGKSRLARDVLSALGLPFTVVDAGTTMDQGLTGSARRWSSSYPSVPVRMWVEHETANVGVIVDELEKAGRSSAGSLHDPLLSLLEPSTAARWRDHFLDASVDASMLTWLCTANSLAGIPAPLLSRLRVLRVERPTAEHVPALVERIRLDVLAEARVDPALEPPLDGEELAAVAAAFGTNGSLRDLRRYVEGILEARSVTAPRH